MAILAFDVCRINQRNIIWPTALLICFVIYTGSTSITNGTLRLAAGGSLPATSLLALSSGTTFDLNNLSTSVGAISGTGAVTLGSGTLTLSSGTASGPISGTGGLTKVGTGTLSLSVANTFTGNTLVSAGTLFLGNAAALGATAGITVNGGTLDLAGQTLAQAVNLAGAGTSGLGAVYNSSAVAASLTGAVTLTGATTVRVGTGSLTLSGPVGGNATLTTEGTGSIVLSGGLGLGGGGLVKNGTGTLTLGGSQSSQYAGATVVNAGTLALAGTAGAVMVPGDLTIGDGTGTDTVRLDASAQIAFGARVTLAVGGVLDLNGSTNALASLVGNGGTVSPNGGSLTVDGLALTGGGVAASAAGGSVTVNGSVALGGTTAIANTVSAGGSVVNNGTASFTGTFTAGGGATSNVAMTVGAAGRFTANGAGLDNEGTLTLFGGTLAGSGSLVNNGLATGNGTVEGTGGFVNNAQFTQSGGNLVVANTGANTNYGTFNLASGYQLRLTGSGLTNYGTLNTGGGVVAGTGTLVNAAGGTLSGSGAVLAPLSNAGGSILVSGGTLNVQQAFTSSGLIQLGGTGSSLVGGALTNSGIIQGAGNVGNAVTNKGSVLPQGGTLVFSGAMQNAAGRLVRVSVGNTFFATAGLAINAGVINLTGGTFDNNGRTLNNTGQLSGYGALATGGLTNNGSLTLTGGATTVNGDVTNAAGRTISVAYNPATFTGNVVNNGTFRTTGTTTIFAGSFTNNGVFVSEPSTQTFLDLTVGEGGALQAGAGNTFVVNGNFYNRSAQGSVFDTTAAQVTLSGATAHRLAWAGADLGATTAGYHDNFALGLLVLAPGATLSLVDGNGILGGALYVTTLRLDGGLEQISRIMGNGLSIYYDPADAGNAYLGGGTYALAGGGVVAPVPEPRAWVILGLGVVPAAAASRRRAPGARA